MTALKKIRVGSIIKFVNFVSLMPEATVSRSFLSLVLCAHITEYQNKTSSEKFNKVQFWKKKKLALV